MTNKKRRQINIAVDGPAPLADITRYNLRRAKNGDGEAAREVMKVCSVWIRRGEMPPPDVQRYLADVLFAIGKGETLAKALRVKSRTKYDNEQRDIEIAFRVHNLVHAGKSENKAADKVVGDYSLDISNVSKIYRGYRADLPRKNLYRDMSILYRVGEHVWAGDSVSDAAAKVAAEDGESLSAGEIETIYRSLLPQQST